MTAVPRLFEQVYHKIVKKGKAAGGWKTRLFEWSLDVGQDYWAAKDKHESVSPGPRRKACDRQPARLFKMARRRRRKLAILCFGRGPAVEKIVLRLLGGGDSDLAGLRHDRGVHRLRQPAG